MKHTEKLDIALQLSYQNRFSTDFQSLENLFESENIALAKEEELIILERLAEDGYIKLYSSIDSSFFKMNSYGIEYCEDRSYTISNTPIATKLVVNVYNQIETTAPHLILDEIESVKRLIENSNAMDQVIALELAKCLDELGQDIEDTKSIPKSKVRNLLSLTADSATAYSLISNFLIEILK